MKINCCTWRDGRFPRSTCPRPSICTSLTCPRVLGFRPETKIDALAWRTYRGDCVRRACRPTAVRPRQWGQHGPVRYHVKIDPVAESAAPFFQAFFWHYTNPTPPPSIIPRDTFYVPDGQKKKKCLFTTVTTTTTTCAGFFLLLLKFPSADGNSFCRNPLSAERFGSTRLGERRNGLRFFLARRPIGSPTYRYFTPTNTIDTNIWAAQYIEKLKKKNVN